MGRMFRLAFVAVALIVIGCNSNHDLGEDISAGRFLTTSLGHTHLNRVSDVRLFVDTSLGEYMDGGAEQYLACNFKELATADYNSGGSSITIDIFEFDSAVDAFGLYSLIRPSHPTTVEYGIEGFASTSNIRFVKGPFVVSVTGYDDGETTVDALVTAAKYLSDRLPGAVAEPPGFEQLPSANAIAASDRYIAHNFLGKEFLTGVYTRLYVIDSDTLRLFITRMNTGQSLLAWSKEAEADNNLQLAPQDLPFDDGKAFITVDSRRGRIIAGIHHDYLVGIVGYRDSDRPLLADWLKSLP